MRYIMSLLLISALAVAAAPPLSAQGNPRGAAKLVLAGKTISVDYGRPSLKGRAVPQVMEQLPAGEVWRLGADQATTLATAADLAFDAVTVPAGEYSLWIRKEGDGSWKLIFNQQHGQWGTQHDPGQDFAGVPLKQTKLTKAAEQFTISLGKAAGGGLISFQWGDLGLSAKFKAQ